jgi:hypothetical protein
LILPILKGPDAEAEAVPHIGEAEIGRLHEHWDNKMFNCAGGGGTGKALLQAMELMRFSIHSDSQY